MKRFQFFIWLLLPIFSFAQSNFKKGYLINNQKDTLRGFIELRERLRNPKEIIFKKSLTDQTQLLTLGELAGFGIDGGENFQKHQVSISMSKINNGDLSIGIDSAKTSDYVFLKVLEDGPRVILFSYQDDIKLRFYIMNRYDGVALELIRNLYYDPDHHATTKIENRYVFQLAALLRKFGVSYPEDELKALKFYGPELAKIVRFINGSGEKKEKSSAPSIRFFAGAGLSLSKSRYSGEGDFIAAGAEGKTSTGLTLSTGVDVYFNPQVKKLIFRTELSYSAGKYSLSVSSPDPAISLIVHHFNQSVFTLNPQLIYNFYQGENLQVFAGFGLGINYANYNKNQRVRFNSLNGEYFDMEEVQLEKLYFSFPLSLGVTLNKRVEFFLAGALPEVVSNYLGFNVHIQRYRVGVRYLFGK